MAMWRRFDAIMRFNFNEDREWEQRMRNLVSVMLPQVWDGNPRRWQ